MELTDKEREVYEYIAGCIKRNGFAPSVRDIREALDIGSTSTVHSYLGKLERAGYITRSQGKSRAMRTRESGAEGESIRVPILGRVTAGTPILAVEENLGFVDYRAKDAANSRYFALKVCGESMIEAGIMDGDTVVVRSTSAARNGNIVVALIDDEATVKEFYREDGHFRLQPRNPAMEPIIVDEVSVLGVVTACTRRYE